MKNIFFFLFFSNAVFAGELHGPHNHGEMEFLVLWQDNLLQVSLLGSAEDLVGFERDPATAKEKKALRKFDQKYDPLEIIKFDPEAECTFIRGRSSSDLFSASPHKHGFLDKTHTHELGLQGHIDFLIRFQYECKSAPGFQLDIFELTPSIKKVNVRTGVIDGDIKVVLTKENDYLLVE